MLPLCVALAAVGSMSCEHPDTESVRHPATLLKHTPMVRAPVTIPPAYGATP